MIPRNFHYSDQGATYRRPVPPELTADVAVVAINYPLRHLKVMKAYGGRFNKTEGGNSVLLTVVAHSATQAACWMAFNHRALGIKLDAQDRFPPCAPEDNWCAPPELDIRERFNWHQGEYLRNNALLLALKKGRQHRAERVRGAQPMGLAIDAILRAGAKVNMQDASGNTGLHVAALHRDVVSIENLKAKGARLDIANNAGLKPVDLLDVNYKDINPYLFQQTGGDTNCYIHTLAPQKEWRATGSAALKLLRP